MEFLFASLLTCSQAQWIAEGAILSVGMTAQEKVEVIQEILNATEPDCEFDGYSNLEFDWSDESTR